MKNNIVYALLLWIKCKILELCRCGKVCVLRLIGMKKPLPIGQQLGVNRFRNATHYAKAQMCDREMKSVYQRGVNDKKRSAYVVAVTDALNAPDVSWIDANHYRGEVGDIISIKATDDFLVAHVKVLITNSNGHELECGEAVVRKHVPHVWTYTARKTNQKLTGTTISVTAIDLPGNRSTLQKVLSLNHQSDSYGIPK
ncbi:hypothetical protein BH10BAC4_BH10BAC4_13270 [soil metagenome]